MADNNLLEQMLEHLVNEEKEQAEELFHQYVVEKSREIYESLLDDEEVEIDESTEEEDDEKEDEDTVEESFEELDLDEDDMDADPADDLINDVEDDMEEDDEAGEEPEELFQDLEDIVDELQAKFDELSGDNGDDMDMDDEGDDMDMDDEEEEIKDDFDMELATIREYVEKVAGGHGAETKGSAESADNKDSVVAGKNDMGGTASNIAQAEEGKGGSDNGLLGKQTKEDNMGNVNVPGGKASKSMQAQPKGHGAEKKGSVETADNKDSLFK